MKKRFLTLLALGGVICSATAQNLEQTVAKQIKEKIPSMFMLVVPMVLSEDRVNYVDTVKLEVPLKANGKVDMNKLRYLGNQEKGVVRLFNKSCEMVSIPRRKVGVDTTMQIGIPQYFSYLHTQDQAQDSYREGYFLNTSKLGMQAHHSGYMDYINTEPSRRSAIRSKVVRRPLYLNTKERQFVKGETGSIYAVTLESDMFQ